MEEGLDSRGGGGIDWVNEERNVGSDPRTEECQRDRLGETSNNLEDKEAIWSRRDWALRRGGRRGRRAEDVAAEGFGGCCCC